MDMGRVLEEIREIRRVKLEAVLHRSLRKLYDDDVSAIEDWPETVINDLAKAGYKIIKE
jgi:hypothetical protein